MSHSTDVGCTSRGNNEETTSYWDYCAADGNIFGAGKGMGVLVSGPLLFKGIRSLAAAGRFVVLAFCSPLFKAIRWLYGTALFSPLRPAVSAVSRTLLPPLGAVIRAMSQPLLQVISRMREKQRDKVFAAETSN